MPIRSFINSAHAFDSQTAECMNLAFAGVCAELGLHTNRDKATEVVAHRVIAMAADGVHDAAQLQAAVLKSLRP